MNDAETIASLKAKVVELLEDAEEGWAYAADYFRDKWRWDERRSDHLLYLKKLEIERE